jgi:hypothetical protein
MKCVIVLAASLATMFSTQAEAQGRDSRDDGAAARTDAILGTPNRTTPVPQTNRFSTAPGLEQQAPAPPPVAGSGRSDDQGASSDKGQRPIRP